MLTDMQAKNAKPARKPYKLSDTAGLYLFVRPTGSKQWRYDYSLNRRRKTLTIGSYPQIKLAEARTRRDQAKNSLKKHVDPMPDMSGTDFKSVALEWLAKCEREGDRPPTMTKKRWLLDYAYPFISTRPINQITAPELLVILRKLEAPGRYESAKRLRSILSRIFRYAIATGRAERDPAADLVGALTAPKVKHHSAFTDPKDIAALLHAINGYPSQLTRYALFFIALTFVRPGELRHAEWPEFNNDFDEFHTEWHIPAARMKMKHPHIVPLSRQARIIRNQIHALTGDYRYVFPSLHAKDRPMCENTLNTALRRMGFTNEQMTSHGFRTMASTRLNEMGWHPDAIERQLAHRPTNQVRAAYNQAEYLTERTMMMQAWADYLEELYPFA